MNTIFKLIFFLLYIFFCASVYSENSEQYHFTKDSYWEILSDKPLVLAGKDFICEEEKEIRKISFFFGYYSFLDFPIKKFFEEETSFYRINERLNISDFLISLVGWPVTISSKTLYLEKCSPDDTNYRLLTEKGWEKLLEDTRKDAEEQIWKEIEDEEGEIPNIE